METTSELSTNDKVGIYAAYPEAEQLEKIGSVSRDYAKYLKRQLEGKEEGGFSSVVDQLLEKAGFKARITERDYHISFHQPVLDVVLRSDISLTFLQKVLETKESIEYFSKHLRRGHLFNIESTLLEELASLDPEEPISNILKLINSTWEIKPPIATVSVGKGELCLAMLTNARKATGRGERGDLIINGEELELKGHEGRCGGSAFALRTAKTLTDTLDVHGYNLSTGKQFRDIRERYYNLNQEYILEEYDAVIDSIRRTTQKSVAKSRRATDDQKEFYVSMVQTCRDFFETNAWAKSLTMYPRIDTLLRPFNAMCQSASESMSELKTPVRLFNNVVKKSVEYIKLKYENETFLTTTGKSMGHSVVESFNQAVQNFFLNDWKLPLHVLVDAFMDCRNEDLPADELELIKLSVGRFIDENAWELKTGNGKLLRQGIMALHATCYYYSYKFKHLLLVQDCSKPEFVDFYKNAYTLTFDSNDIFTDVLEQIQKLNITTTLSLDKQFRNGVTMSLQS